MNRARQLQLLLYGLILTLVVAISLDTATTWAQDSQVDEDDQTQAIYLPTIAQAATPAATPVAVPTAVPTVPPRPPASDNCATTSSNTYASVPVAGPTFLDADHSAEISPDLNLTLRSYRQVTAPLELMNINGPTASDPPQLGGIDGFAGPPHFTAAYQVHDWDWTCGSVEVQAAHHGCRSAPISYPHVTLIGLKTAAGAPLYVPTRRSQILAGGYVAMVLYAQADRVTLTYTRDDTPALGYLVHLENICVDPNLLALYQAEDSAGRIRLPALRNGEQLGTAPGDNIGVAIRDSGSFMDPRSRKDWWQDY